MNYYGDMENRVNNNFKPDNVLTIIKQILSDNKNLHPDTAVWIIVKTLRVFKKDFKNIKQIEVVQFERMVKFATRVRNGETLAQVFGEVEFYGNILKTAPSVFSPRLSTEALVTAVINENSHKKNLKILDLCTGSGSVAVTLAKHLNAKVYAVDISKEALAIAKENAKRLGVKCAISKMDILKPWKKLGDLKFDIIVSNPPYWNASKILGNPEVVKGNPIEGFMAGEDGLEFHKEIIKNAPNFLKKGGQLYLEMEEDQMPILYNLMKNKFKTLTTEKDYRGITRVITGVKKDFVQTKSVIKQNSKIISK